MEIPTATFAAGAVLGLASALHCASMCGGISAAMLSLFSAGAPRYRLAILLTLQGGRIAAYTTMGALVGLAGSGAFELLLEPRLAARILQWAAAVSLMWIGLSIAGLMPAVAALNGPLTGLSGMAGRLLAPARKRPFLAPLAAGVTWGMSPCPMVYGALFTSALTGSTAGGATLMAGFGIGTLPAVVASALGLASLPRLGARPWARAGIGLAIAALGFSTVYFKWPAMAPFCLTL